MVRVSILVPNGRIRSFLGTLVADTPSLLPPIAFADAASPQGTGSSTAPGEAPRTPCPWIHHVVVLPLQTSALAVGPCPMEALVAEWQGCSPSPRLKLFAVT